MPKHPRLTVRNGVFYHRAAIPADIRETYGKREEIKSLGTRDPMEALKLVRVEAARVDALFDAHRREFERRNASKLSALTPEQIRVVADAFHALILEEDEQERLRGFTHDDDFNLFTQDAEVVERLARELYARGQVPPFVKLEYERIIQRLGLPWPLEESSDSWPVLSRAMVAASIKAIEERKQRNAGNVVETPEIIHLRPGSIPAKTVTLSDLFAAWAKDHRVERKPEKTVTDFKQKVNAFAKFLKHEDATKVTRKDMADFCDHLRHERGLSAKTVASKYLTAIKILYRTGVAKVMLDNDPSERVSVRVPKKIHERPQGFTDDEAKIVLKSALDDPEKLGKMASLNKLAVRWAPWICAYTGARIGEVCQLRKEDFGEEYGIPYLRITPEAGSVKTGRFRQVPIHQHLIEMGLLDFIKASPKGPLFYRQGQTKPGSVRGKVSEWVRHTAKVTDPRLQPNHAWRHRFKTIARDVGIEQRYMDAIQGHKDGTSSAEYGENTMKALNREIQKMPRYEVVNANRSHVSTSTTPSTISVQ